MCKYQKLGDFVAPAGGGGLAFGSTAVACFQSHPQGAWIETPGMGGTQAFFQSTRGCGLKLGGGEYPGGGVTPAGCGLKRIPASPLNLVLSRTRGCVN